ncbi:MAG: cytochrome [Solirubrobacteraceae bacterium]|jgi:cytochrome c553|nr:cytochrome [Solirubrobacteraceae bacterium]
MAVLLFVLLFVGLAVGLVVIGLRSGAKGKPTNVNVQRGGRAHWYISFALVLLVVGIGVPIASSFGRDHDAKNVPQSDLTDISNSQEHGRELFHKFCAVCHTLAAANAVAQVGPNLDTLRPNQALVLDAIKNGRARGNGAMARNLVTGSDANDVANFVAAAVGNTPTPTPAGK